MFRAGAVGRLAAAGWAALIRLSATGLACVRGGREVFSGLEFSVAAGEALAVLGPNGAGKTTLLRALAGLLRLAAGRVELTGGEAEAVLAEQVHYLAHLDALKPALSVAENLTFWARFLGGGRASVAEALAAAGLDRVADLPAAYLSAGQRRRLSIARLVAVARPVWLLDEPSAALDTAGQGMLAALMSRHLASGGMIVAATHAPLGVKARELPLGGSATRLSGGG